METEERNLGPQPILAILEQRGLSAHDLVAASKVPMTHKMVARATRGRRLTRNTKEIVRAALESATGEEFALESLFNY